MKKIIKNILLVGLLLFICFFEFPYYIDAPGGLDNINNKVKVDNAYESKGSINLSYVSQYKATLPMLLVAYFNPNWKIESKKKQKTDDLDYDELLLREHLEMKQSYSNAIKYAYSKANKTVNVIEEKCNVIYVYKDADTDLKVGDQILSIDDKKINKCEEISDLVNSKKENDESIIKVINNNKEYERKVKYISINDMVVIGIQVSTEYILETEPKYKFKYSDREYGPSGGLMISLAVYNSLIEKDITGGKKIAGTGTLNSKGLVGPIGGVEYKLKGAVKNKADVFFVPAGENYEEAIKLKEKNKYKIDIVQVETFDDALKYLEKIS